MTDHLEWKVLSTETVRRDEWIDFRANRCELPNGKIIDPFYTYRKCNFAVIVATTPEGDYICVRQYRLGIGRTLLEFPAGAVEPGEDPLNAAKRELSEETGYTSDEWTRLCRIAPNATIADNFAYCYAARNCRRTAERHLDETECVDAEIVPKKKMQELIRHDGMVQAVHVAAYFLAAERED